MKNVYRVAVMSDDVSHSRSVIVVEAIDKPVKCITNEPIIPTQITNEIMPSLSLMSNAILSTNAEILK